MKENDTKKLLLLAEKGHPHAQYKLGEMYHTGVIKINRGLRAEMDVEHNDVEAAKWYRKAEKGFRKAAEKGDIEALYQLADMYFWVHPGLDPDKAESIKWFKKAAEKGHAEFANELGEMYWSGVKYGDWWGVEPDDAEAAKWFKKAAEKGHAFALHSLGLLYYHGKGVEKDYAEAIKWFNLAAEQGHQDAKEASDRIEKQMTPAQLAEAQRRAPE